MKKQIGTKGITSLEARIKNRPFIPILIAYEIQIEQCALQPCYTPQIKKAYGEAG